MKIWGYTALSVVFFISAMQGWATTFYVSVSNTTPVSPFTSWSTAATNIQDAINVASAGDQVLVTNGIYQVGQTSLSGNNRVAVANAIALQSINGPATTRIDGGHTVRCVYLGSGATISGFTLANGSSSSVVGGGVLCLSGATVSNCVIVGNSSSAGGGGGGGINGKYIDCLITGNTATGNSSGGGITSGYLTNCVLAGNSSGVQGGGGTYSPQALVNCTVVNNSSSGNGGGVYAYNACTFRNSIIYFNSALFGTNVYSPNLAASSISNCCAPEFPFPGCITNMPGLVDVVHGDYHLQIGSPCIDTGDNSSASVDNDLDGNPRIFGATVDMGAYENQFTGTVHFVNLSNKTPLNPYTNMLTAATNIQDAIDAASEGEFVIVANGSYKFGGRVVYGALTNRVVINKPVTVLSLNGPTVTLIVGNHVNGANAARCVYMTNNAVLSGFTLTNGATDTSGDVSQSRSGGGVWSESTDTLINNCLITFNMANSLGGGAFSGTLTNCSITQNNASSYGGGSAYSTLANCIVSNNFSSTGGGGAVGGFFNGCTLVANNSAGRGGAAISNVLINTTISSNWALLGGGGVFSCSLTNCTLSGNSITNRDGGGAIFSVLTGCTLTGNKARYGGGSCSNMLNNCLLTGNVATNGGGAYCGSLVNCTLNGNSAVNYGGGAFYANLTNCTLVYNGASYGGGVAGGICSGCFISNNVAGSLAGGVISNTAINCIIGVSNLNGGSYYSTLNECSLIRNMGGGSHFDVLNNCLLQLNFQGDGAASSTLNNCTVINNGNGAGLVGTRNCNVTNSVVYFNTSGGNFSGGTMDHCCVTPLTGTGCFTNAPLFLDSVHPQSNSPCIDGGNNLASGIVDIDGRPRIVNGTVDVGAAEFQGVAIEPFILWLVQYSLPNDGSGDYADSDGDGLNNWQEWSASTIPTNAASALKLLSPTNSVSGTAITWQSNTNVTYYLQRSTNLSTGFTALVSNLVGQLVTTSYTDSSATNSDSYFYRVGVQ